MGAPRLALACMVPRPVAGQQIRQMLERSGGDFPTVELNLKKWGSKIHRRNKHGKWVTRHILTTKEGWSKSGPQILPHT